MGQPDMLSGLGHVQVSDQAVRLYQQGWFLPPDDPGAATCTLQDPRVGPFLSFPSLSMHL